MIARRKFLALAATAFLPARAHGQAGSVPAITVSTLSPGAALPDWLEPVTFGEKAKPTEFALVADEGRTVLRTHARGSASGLARTMRVNPAEFPILAWRWKAQNLVARGGLGTKEGDDFALRLYVTFDLDPDLLTLGDRMKISLARAFWGAKLPLAALCYVWDLQAPRGAIVPNAYTDRVRMVVADSGSATLGRWVDRERNLAEDFRLAFGLPVPQVTSVIVSADTDNTGESTEAFFGDIVFRKQAGS